MTRLGWQQGYLKEAKRTSREGLLQTSYSKSLAAIRDAQSSPNVLKAKPAAA